MVNYNIMMIVYNFYFNLKIVTIKIYNFKLCKTKKRRINCTCKKIESYNVFRI